MRLVLFDLDNTLLSGDSDVEWPKFLIRKGFLDEKTASERNEYFHQEYKAGRLNILEFLAFQLAPLAQFSIEELAQLHQAFMEEHIRPLMSQKSHELVQKHLQAGDLVAVITATNRFVTGGIVQAFGIEHLIATEAEHDAEGRYTGRPTGVPCFQAGKITRLNAWLAKRGQTLEAFEETWFYSDSLNDLPLLERVTHPVAVDPDDTLRAHAEEKGWPILSLRDETPPKAALDLPEALQPWLFTVLKTYDLSLAPASSDASFRRYFRVTANATGQHYIVMDAPPEKEDCRPFLAVQALLAEQGVPVPQVFAKNLEHGFLLLEDFGSTPYLSALTAETASKLYGMAFDVLVEIQRTPQPATLPLYDAEKLTQELNLFPEWYVEKHLNTPLTEVQKSVWSRCVKQLVEAALAQPQVMVHRDYHSRNLMLTPAGGVGVLDFQDAVWGPISYDLVSLLKDAYIEWEESHVLDWAIRYWEKARKAGLPIADDFGVFYRDFEWMGIQRHLKVLGIFARLAFRDGKTGYLKDLPLVEKYLISATKRYDELRPLLMLFKELGMINVQTGYTF